MRAEACRRIEVASAPRLALGAVRAGALLAAVLVVGPSAYADEPPGPAAAAQTGANVATASRGGPTRAPRSIWDGVFTEDQARRGAAVYTGPCSHCHGYRLDGAPDDPDMYPTPPIGGPKFLRNWEGRSLAVLFEYTRATMPGNNPSYLADEEYAEVIAYMLAASGLPAGDAALASDPRLLTDVVIGPAPAPD